MKNKAFPISMTVLWGMVFGSAMHSLTMGICMGLMMGIAFGLLRWLDTRGVEAFSSL